MAGTAGLAVLKTGLALLAVAAASLSASDSLPTPPLGVAFLGVDGVGVPVRMGVDAPSDMNCD